MTWELLGEDSTGGFKTPAHPNGSLLMKKARTLVFGLSGVKPLFGDMGNQSRLNRLNYGASSNSGPRYRLRVVGRQQQQQAAVLL